MMFGRFNGASTFSKGIQILLIVLAIGYGWAFSFFIDYLHDRGESNERLYFFFMNIAIAALMIVTEYFPQHSGFQHLFSISYPLRTFEKAASVWGYYFLSLSNLLPFVFCSGLFVSCSHYTFTQFLLSILVVLLAFTAELAVKISIRVLSKLVMYVFSSIGLLVLFFGAYHFYLQQEKSIVLLAFLVLPLLLIVCIKSYSSYLQKEADIQPKGQLLMALAPKLSASYPLDWRLLVKNKLLFPTLTIAAVFKIIMASIVTAAVFSKKNSLSDNNLIVSLIGSPLIFFTYAFNNMFGYLSRIFMHVGYSSRPMIWLKFYIRAIAPLLVVDFFISFFILSCVNKGASIAMFLYLVFLYTSTFVLGYCSSILLPKVVSSAIDFTSFKSNTSFISSLLLVTFTIVSFTISKHHMPFLIFAFLTSCFLGVSLFWLQAKYGSRSYVKLIEKII